MFYISEVLYEIMKVKEFELTVIFENLWRKLLLNTNFCCILKKCVI